MLTTPTHSAQPSRRSPAPAFLLIAFALIAGNALIVHWYPSLLDGHAGAVVPEWPVAVDLLLVLPLVYLWLYRDAGKGVWLRALGVLGLGVLAGSWILPADSKQLWPWLEQSRWLLLLGVLLVQALLLTLIVREAYLARHSDNLELAVHAALERRLGRQFSTGLLQLEARMWMYALLRDPLRHRLPGDVHFSSHAQNGNLSNQQGFLILVGAEIPLLHLLLHFAVDPVIAWIVTTVSIYGWIFLWAEYRATRLRDISMDQTQLFLRCGLLTDLQIPLTAVSCVELHRDPVRRQRGRLRLYGMGAPNVRIELRPDTRVHTLLGEQLVEEIMLGVDTPVAFVNALRERIG
jgi:hypothetical protein